MKTDKILGPGSQARQQQDEFPRPGRQPGDMGDAAGHAHAHGQTQDAGAVSRPLRSGALYGAIKLNALSGFTQEDTSVGTIGQRLSKARKTAGLTQVECAKRLGTTQPSLARLEKDAALPNLSSVARYAAAVGIGAFAEITLADGRAVVVDVKDVMGGLTQLRKQSGLTQSEVASKMQTTQPIVARLEGGYSVPNLSTLMRYSQAIDCDLGIRLAPPESD